MPCLSTTFRYNTRQQGAFSILTAFTLVMLLLFLALVLDSGRLYMEQQRLQKIADMAALEAVSRLANGNCAAQPDDATNYVRDNASRHGFEDGATQSLLTQCATVTPGDVKSGGARTIKVDPAGRAVKVTASKNVRASLVAQLLGRLSEIDLRAEATAERETPTASFSVGAQFLRLNSDLLLGQVLRTVGLSADQLAVLDSDGLASAQITPAGLLKALGVEVGIQELKALSPQGLVDLVNTEVGLLGIDRLIGLSAEVISDSLLLADLDLLRQDILSKPLLRDADLKLFGTETEPGLLRLASSPDGTVGSALDAAVNLGELLGASILVGVQQHNEHEGRGLLVDGLKVLGLAQVELGIVEPPSIGIGPVGTKAYNAQVRLYVGVDTNNLLGGLLAWLTDTILGTRVNLPIWIDVVSGEGTLEEIHCKAGTPTADIRVETDILNACVGKMPEESKWSTTGSCETTLQEDELLRLLHIPVLSGKTHIPALRHSDELKGMSADETRSTTANPLALGETVEELVVALLDLLSGLFRKPNNDDPNLEYSQAAQNELIAKMATQYLDATKDSLGFYNVDAVINLILDGSDQLDSAGNQVLPPLVSHDWNIPNSIPRTCLLTTCPSSTWRNGTFSEAFKAYSLPHGLLDVLGISTLGNGYYACGGLLSSLLAWNTCVENNLTKLLQNKPDGLNLSANTDGQSLANPNNNQITCSGMLCGLLKPVLELLKPLLNGIGAFLTTILADVLGLELGRTDVTLHSVSCGTPQLVR